MSFIGWFFLGIFGGVGLAALPIDLILEFKNRPVIVYTLKRKLLLKWQPKKYN